LPGLHITQGIFTKLFNLLEDLCNYDVKLAACCETTTGASAVFQKYRDGIKTMKSSQSHAQEYLVTLEQISCPLWGIYTADMQSNAAVLRQKKQNQSAGI